MSIGIFVLMIMVSLWVDVSMHAMAMKSVKLIALKASKTDNLIVLARLVSTEDSPVDSPLLLVDWDKELIKQNCLGGCPCDNYTCVEPTTIPSVTTTTIPKTTTSKMTNAVLVLSTYNGSNKPMIIDFNGENDNIGECNIMI